MAPAPTDGRETETVISTGLLPNFLSVSGTTRQNDLDVEFTLSMQAGSGLNGGVSSNGSGNSALNNRQAYLSFGDKSWGSIKLGKDLGIFASDAILNDMTLLGVGGNPAAAAGLTTLGRIGNGLVYADWKGQAAYTTPNMNGFQATVGLTQAFDATSSTGAGSSGTYSYDQNNLFTFSPVLTDGTAITISGKNYVVKASGGSFSLEYNGSPALPSDLPGSMTGTYTTGSTSAVSGTYKGQLGYEGKASYSFAEDNVNGEIWVSGIAQRIKGTSDSVASAFDIGANVNFAGNVGLTGYYYEGNGIGTTHQFKDGYSTIVLTEQGVFEVDNSNSAYSEELLLSICSKINESNGLVDSELQSILSCLVS